MSKGLEKILKKIREHPNRRVLRERYLALVSEIESSEERQARMLDLGNIYFNIDPSESMQIAHQVYRQNKKSIKALKLIKLCLDKLGRKGKAAVIDNEIKKIKAEEASEEKPLPSYSNQSSELYPGSEDKTVISESNELGGLPPLPSEEPTSLTTPEHESKPEEAAEYSPSFAIGNQPPDRSDEEIPLASHTPDYTSPAPGIPSQTKESFQAPSLTELKRELQSQSSDTAQSISSPPEPEPSNETPLSYSEPFTPINKRETTVDPIFAPETKASPVQQPTDKEELTKTSKKILPDSVSQLNKQWPEDITTPTSSKFEPSASEEHANNEQPLKETNVKEELFNTTPSLTDTSRVNVNLESLLDTYDLVKFIERSRNRKQHVNTPPLPEAFKKAFQNWFRSKDPLRSKEGEALLWEFIQAIWVPSPQKEAAVFLTQTNLAHRSEGLWGTFLDGLIAAKYYRKVVFEIRYKILKEPNLRWTRVGLPRLNAACQALGFQKLNWKEQDGMDQLCKILSRQFSLNEFLVVP